MPSSLLDLISIAVKTGLEYLMSRKEDLSTVAQAAIVDSRKLLSNLDDLDKWELDQLEGDP